jgi:hypothetical protein
LRKLLSSYQVRIPLCSCPSSPQPDRSFRTLPGFIADTGIATQRDAIKEKEEGQSLKQKTRERVQPKMGKIDIDYQKLHDAFFKYQTKPKMTEFGEM